MFYDELTDFNIIQTHKDLALLQPWYRRISAIVQEGTYKAKKHVSENVSKLLSHFLLGKNFMLGSKAKNADAEKWDLRNENSLPLVAECILQHDRVQQELADIQFVKCRASA